MGKSAHIKIFQGLLLSMVLPMAVIQAAEAQVRVHGATAVTFGLMKLHKAEIEKRSGVELAILPSSTSRGLADLAQGTADIAMLSEPLESAADSINKKTPGTINVANLVGHLVGNAYIQFIIHPSNPVKILSKDQLAGLFSGKYKNWQELGGANLPVLLIGEPTSAPHKLISQTLAITYAVEMRAVQNTNQTALIISQAPGAISYISTAHDIAERSKLQIVESPVKIPLELYLAIRRDASGPIKKVIEAAAAVATK